MPIKKSCLSLLLILCFAAIVFLILFLGTLVHELGHINTAKEQNISLVLKGIDWTPKVQGWGAGRAEPLSYADCERFNALPLDAKKEITHAGFKQEIYFSIAVYIIISFFSIRHSQYLWKNSKFALVLLLTLNLLPLVMISFSFYGNVFSSNPKADWNVLFLNCSAYS